MKIDALPENRDWLKRPRPKALHLPGKHDQKDHAPKRGLAEAYTQEMLERRRPQPPMNWEDPEAVAEEGAKLTEKLDAQMDKIDYKIAKARGELNKEVIAINAAVDERVAKGFDRRYLDEEIQRLSVKADEIVALEKEQWQVMRDFRANVIQRPGYGPSNIDDFNRYEKQVERYMGMTYAYQTLWTPAARAAGWTDPPEIMYSDVLRAVSEFNRVHDVYLSGVSVLEFTKPRACAYLDYARSSINVGRAERDPAKFISTMFHEYGHFVERDYADLQKMAGNFRFKRADLEYTDHIRPLNRIMEEGGYGQNYYEAHEEAYRDKWAHPYVGKVYRYADTPRGSGGRYYGTTEVLSTGYGYLSDSKGMIDLYYKDREHFNIMVAVVQEVRRRQDKQRAELDRK